MSVAAATAKGSATRERVLECAYRLACRLGLEGLSIGDLAAASGMSKSGVFAHFGSREELQHNVLDWTAESFVEQVFRPALAQPRGLRRLNALVELWLAWIEANPDGCVILGASVEFDGRPGALREHTARLLSEWVASIEHSVRLAIDTGELREDTDPALIAFQILALLQGMHHARLFQAEQAAGLARRAIAHVFDTHRR